AFPCHGQVLSLSALGAREEVGIGRCEKVRNVSTGELPRQQCSRHLCERVSCKDWAACCFFACRATGTRFITQTCIRATPSNTAARSLPKCACRVRGFALRPGSAQTFPSSRA